MGVCYAVSVDGIRWQKSDLGLIEFNGSTRNNLVMRDVHGVGVTLDPHDPDPAGRVNAFMEGGVARSPDGLRWSAMQPCPEIDARWDTHNNLFWDERHARYVGITRLWDGRQRTVGRTESEDFNTWTPAVEVLSALPGEPERQTYALIAFPYAQLYLGLLLMFNTETDLVDCELAWSRDTVQWQRVSPGTPLIERGEEGSFDWGCVYAAAYPFLKDGRLQLYYGGSDGPHTDWRAAYLGLATLRPDGFAGLTPVKRAGPPRSSHSLYNAVDANSASAPPPTAVWSERRWRMSMARALPIRFPSRPMSPISRCSGATGRIWPRWWAGKFSASSDYVPRRSIPSLSAIDPMHVIPQNARRVQRVVLAAPPSEIRRNSWERD